MNNAAIQRACEALPLWRNPLPRARYKRGVLPVSGTGGKLSIAVTYLNDAQRERLLAPSLPGAARDASRWRTVARQEFGAIVRTTSGHDADVVVRAPRVVVAAEGIQSPALLLRSGVSLPHLGRNLFLHPTTAIPGVDDDRVEVWSGPPQTILSRQFANLNGGYGFRMESDPGHPGLMGATLSWTSAAQHRRLMQRVLYQCDHRALSRRRDRAESPRARTGRGRRRPAGPAEQHLVALGTATAARIHLAAGAREVHTLTHGRCRFVELRRRRKPTSTRSAIA